MSSTDLPTETSRAWVEVDLRALRSNVRALRTFLGPDRGILAVIKADAYGHGQLPVARAAREEGAHWLGVAAVAEGIALREAGMSAPIALLCAAPPDSAPAIVRYGLTPQVGDEALLVSLERAVRHSAGAVRLEIHLEIDTGMGRSGVLPEDAVALWRAARSAGLAVTGLSTHFADADSVDTRNTEAQWERFRHTRRALEAAGARFDWVHASNSPATLRFGAEGCNLVRPGLLLYGILPPTVGTAYRIAEGRVAAPNLPLRPVLSLKARVAAVRTLPAGASISYGATYRLSRQSRIATVLIGYGDGYPRRLSNRGSMLLRGRRAPILGRVCMDQTVVDATDIPQAAPGDAAICIGAEGEETIAVEKIAREIDATEHEITTCLTPRLPRIYRDG